MKYREHWDMSQWAYANADWCVGGGVLGCGDA